MLTFVHTFVPNLDNFLTMALLWLISYIVHSSTLLGIAALSQHYGLLTSRRFAERVWRLALFGGVCSSSIFCGFIVLNNLQHNASTSPLQTPTINAASEPMPNTSRDADQAPATGFTSSHSSLDERGSTNSSPNTIPSDALSPSLPIVTRNLAMSWQLPASLKQLLSALFAAWLLYAGMILAKTFLSVGYLHHMLARLPLAQREDLLDFVRHLAPHKNITIRVCHERRWNSPFASPNGTIYMPAWTLDEVAPEQTYAMLAHEVRHVLRADGQWRIAQQLMTSIFFFQFFNRYANHHLDLLAEIDCDYSAIQSCSVEHYSRSLLRCAEMFNAHNAPAFASAMAKPSSLLHRINLLFNEDAMHTLVSEKNTKQINARLLGLSLLTIASLSGISYATPAIQFSQDDLPHSSSLNLPLNPGNPTTTTSKTSSEPTQRFTLTETRVPASANLRAKTPTNEVNIAPKPEQTLTQITATQATVRAQNISLEQAHTAYREKDFTKAFELFSVLAKSGNPEAQFAAGDMLWRGEGSQINPDAAMTFLTQAANQGHDKAQKYATLFAERKQHQSELNFSTQQFDGGKLKWTEQTCERPTLSNNRPSSKDFTKLISQLNMNLTCYNHYVASLKQSLANGDYLSADLRRLMRTDEIEQAQKLAQNVYYEMGLQAMHSSEQLLADFDRKNQVWSKEINEQAMRNDTNGVESLTAYFERMSRPPVKPETGISYTVTSSNPNVSPINK